MADKIIKYFLHDKLERTVTFWRQKNLVPGGFFVFFFIITCQQQCKVGYKTMLKQTVSIVDDPYSS